jgi:hypothetical protein
MAIDSAYPGAVSSPSGVKRVLAIICAAVVTALVVLVIAALTLSGVSLASNSTALAKVSVQPLGGTLEGVQAYGPAGHRLPIALSSGRITPLTRLTPGEHVTIDVEVRRAAWLGWALGDVRKEQLTLRAPVATVSQPWLTVASGSPVRVSFDEPVSEVAYYTASGLTRRKLAGGGRTVSLGKQPATGATEIAAAPRSWEKVGPPTQVSWFPPSSSPVMATIPAAGDSISPTAPLYLTFSKTVSEALGSGRPQLSPNVAGKWREANSHTLVFTPAGFGAPLGSTLRVQLPSAVAVTAGSGSRLRTTSAVEWSVPQGSTLRLQQLLAETGYLPVIWHPSGAPVARTASAQAAAAVDPPSGTFTWRYPNTPHQLQALWAPGQWSIVMKGAVMKFENNNELTVDGEPGPAVWRALLNYVLAGKHLNEGYSYVYVHREVPETMTLWSAGQTIETSAANTGIAGAETELGTFAVFEHIPEGTMSGTNPDGSHYEDPGIKWISYFNGGDALHNFDRASFGFPQSLGCVELPLEAAAKEWPYTVIGTLVTIET